MINKESFLPTKFFSEFTDVFFDSIVLLIVEISGSLPNNTYLFHGKQTKFYKIIRLRVNTLDYRPSVWITPSRFPVLIYKIRNTWDSRGDVDELRRWHFVFVGSSHRHKIILKWFCLPSITLNWTPRIKRLWPWLRI